MYYFQNSIILKLKLTSTPIAKSSFISFHIIFYQLCKLHVLFSKQHNSQLETNLHDHS